jgi:hypothetical protein
MKNDSVIASEAKRSMPARGPRLDRFVASLLAMMILHDKDN